MIKLLRLQIKALNILGESGKMSATNREIGLLKLILRTMELLPAETLTEITFDDEWIMLYQRYVTRSIHAGATFIDPDHKKRDLS